jgi:hypothetical protein
MGVDNGNIVRPDGLAECIGFEGCISRCSVHRGCIGYNIGFGGYVGLDEQRKWYDAEYSEQR